MNEIEKKIMEYVERHRRQYADALRMSKLAQNRIITIAREEASLITIECLAIDLKLIDTMTI